MHLQPNYQQQQPVEASAGTVTSNAITTDKNVMPSMVVRQRRMDQMGISANQLNRGAGGAVVSNTVASATSSSIKVNELADQQQLFDQNGLVLPKRVMHHPVSMNQPIIRDLNRELKFNQIRGKNVLDQKSELKKALEKLEESKRKKEAEQERLSRRTSLELRLEERAERLAKDTTSSRAGDSQPSATCNHLSNFSIKSITR